MINVSCSGKLNAIIFISRDIEYDLKSDLKSICVVGFEPNPRHTATLLEVQEEYTKCGWSLSYSAGHERCQFLSNLCTLLPSLLIATLIPNK